MDDFCLNYVLGSFGIIVDTITDQAARYFVKLINTISTAGLAARAGSAKIFFRHLQKTTKLVPALGGTINVQ